jgi:hypothetical protein
VREILASGYPGVTCFLKKGPYDCAASAA